MEKLFIKNRQGKNIALNLTKANNEVGLVFIVSGLGAIKENSNIKTFVSSFVEKNFIVISFDVTNGVGESDGDYSKATFTGYYQDLVDIIDWAKSQEWYIEPFVLVGHSMGGVSALLYGINYSNSILGTALISTVISGYQSIARFGKDKLITALKKDKNGKEIIKKIDWEPFKEDILKYDAVSEAHKFIMPILMVVGDKDLGTPLEDQMKLYEGIPGDKEIHIVKGAPHTFEKPEHLDELKQIFHNWIDNKLVK